MGAPRIKPSKAGSPDDSEALMRKALGLARRALGSTSPNPLVGAVLVKHGQIIGQGWHHQAGAPHAEIEALRDAERRGLSPADSTLYVTLEPCSTQGRTPPCTKAILEAGIRRVIVGAIDPNPRHAGRGVRLLQNAGLMVKSGVLEAECAQINAPFNHWIVHRTPLVTVKAAMTLDGKIATASGESKWITGPQARRYAMGLRKATDAILVGINTVLADDPSLTVRLTRQGRDLPAPRQPRRLILDSQARTPLTAKVVSDQFADRTTIFVAESAPPARVRALARQVRICHTPAPNGRLELASLTATLGQEDTTSLLVEGGGIVTASFLEQHLAHRLAFFYAPKVLGGRTSRKAVSGLGFASLAQALKLHAVQWRRLGPDLLLTASLNSALA